MAAGSSEQAVLLRCEQLCFGHAGRPLAPAFDLELRAGEFVAVVGRNGTGKTTWFRTLLGLLPEVSGRVWARPGLRLSYVPQRAQLDPLFPLLARDVVALGLVRGSGFGWPRLREPAIVGQAIAAVGAEAFADRPYRALSEGQKQRVLLGRLYAGQPELALLDEPTSAMDAIAEREALELIDAPAPHAGLDRGRGQPLPRLDSQVRGPGDPLRQRLRNRARRADRRGARPRPLSPQLPGRRCV